MFDATKIRQSVMNASDAYLKLLYDEIKSALEGDSFDAEHDALVAVAQLFGVDWQPPDC